ncbi:MAG: MFS transporter [Alphaproteobacteria bacterium]|nr:MFS transporter [Alphaproteobacteria bacterium SS10]
MNATSKAASDGATKATSNSAWAPFGERAFAVLWVATVVSNIGTWMHDVGAAWLMTELSPSPAIVSLVQAATTLPVFLFAVLAGAVADICDRRRLLIVVNILMAITVAIFTGLVAAGLVTPVVLLVFTFLLGTGAAFMAPAWQAIVPSLVSRDSLPAAVSLNSVGINVSRAIGPALAGILIVSVGITAPFALNFISTIGIVVALIWWRPPPVKQSKLPPEHILGAMGAGLRYARHSAPLKQTLVRAVGFFLFASAYWAMLPLIARDVLQGGATLYGILMGCVGAGAVAGAMVMPPIRKKLGADKTVAAGSIGTALVLAIFAVVPNQILAALAAGLAGASWIAVLSTLNVSAQTSLPNWVRARGLSVFLMVFFGTMALGSILWGQVASFYDVSTAMLIAAAGLVLAIPVTWRAKLGTGAGTDFTPSMHWPTPVHVDEADHHQPVTITATYRVSDDNQDAFLDQVQKLKHIRQGYGAYGWHILQDADDPTVFVESWSESSWTEHLRHHERVSVADQAVQEAVAALTIDGQGATIAHLIQKR